ncbi:DUF1566 domain-containing protein [Psychrobacter pygoscelis]|uniref:Lcl C-terminal domain-containing protein n=1 Tax=Psychrobacter pygoscelis TaxID=2488563 RepID=UPI001039D914|nr:DUF1566 domain-containing protein [Psychrobacter pygoscelis]
MKKISILLTTMALLVSLNSAYAQECNDNTRKTVPDSRFENINNGTVKDKQTGLIWQQCSIGQTLLNGQCNGEARDLTWKQALTEAKAYGEGWRLPNIKELNSILEQSCTDPMLNFKHFPIVNDRFEARYWSATPSVSEVVLPRFNIIQKNNIVTLDLGDGSLAINEPQAEFRGLAVKSAE